MASDNNNNPVYLIVGGLLVAIVVFGLVFKPQNSNLSNIEPAAGTAVYTSNTTTNEKNTVITPSSETGEPGVTTTTTRTKTETNTP